MTLRVIGTGFGRTGTDSLRNALNILGFGPCHHMHEVMPSDAQKAMWDRKSRGEAVNWSEVYAGFGAAVDWPSAAYWEELIATYPDAKVVHTNRDPESWWRSYEKTIMAFLPVVKDDPEKVFAYRIVAEVALGGRYDDREACLARYRENVARVRDIVPKERLLVMELGEGWDRLCAFLEADVPPEPYPSGNTTSDFRQNANLEQPSG